LLVTPSRPEHPGPSKRAGHGVQAEGRLAVSRRCVGRQTTPDGRLMLTVLGGLAEFERSLILRRRPRTRDGTGVRFGRKWKLTAHQIAEARKRREAWGGLERHRKIIQRQPQHDFEALKADCSRCRKQVPRSQPCRQYPSEEGLPAATLRVPVPSAGAALAFRPTR
jgi:hypothetical protein